MAAMALDFADRYTLPLAIFVGASLALLLVRSISLRLLHRWSERTASPIDDIVVRALRGPSILWCLAIGLHLGLSMSELPDKYLIYLERTIRVLVTFSITMAASTIAGKIVRQSVQRTDLPLPTTGLAYGVIKGTILAIGFVIILSQMGIAIAPLLTALGVGGLAVALALQDTLANLFAGIHILVEKSVRVGDVLRLESGQEGAVLDITWRTTRIRTLQNNIVVIPNNKLSQSVVTNFSLPEPRLTLQIPVAVDYESDPRQVERALLDVAAQAASAVPGLLPDPPPVVRFVPGFGPTALEFTLNCQVARYADQVAVQSELRSRIVERFRADGIEFPPVPGAFPRQRERRREGGQPAS
jgi:small-conductance mechanosensitive channel